MFDEYTLFFVPQKVGISYKGTKRASPLQLPYPLNLEGARFDAPGAIAKQSFT